MPVQAPLESDLVELREANIARHGPNRRQVLAGRTCEIVVALETTTPILGGAATTRSIDEVDIIRAPSIRGSLRFWWRALYASSFADQAKQVFEEQRIFGAATDGDVSGPGIRLTCTVDEPAKLAPLQTSENGAQAQDAYALWPADMPRHDIAPRRQPGVKFILTLSCAVTDESVLRSVLKAWILFGGIGSRTRRGVGSLTVVGDEAERTSWLPAQPTKADITNCLGVDIFAPAHAANDTPSLRGAAIHVTPSRSDAKAAWITALGWLKDFRQSPGAGARVASADARRPSVSNWPEADKLRHLRYRGSLPLAHKPRHNNLPVWPRAGFGLPIGGQFQRLSRVPNLGGRTRTIPWNELLPSAPNFGAEPEGRFEIVWHDGRNMRDRLASPLIVKALPLASGKFAPCALWLNRAFPSGTVRLGDDTRGDTAAPFDLLVAPGDTALFAPLSQPTLQQAFLGWLSAIRNAGPIS